MYFVFVGRWLYLNILRNNDFWVFVLVDSLLVLYGCVYEIFFFAYLRPPNLKSWIRPCTVVMVDEWLHMAGVIYRLFDIYPLLEEYLYEMDLVELSDWSLSFLTILVIVGDKLNMEALCIHWLMIPCGPHCSLRENINFFYKAQLYNYYFLKRQG